MCEVDKTFTAAAHVDLAAAPLTEAEYDVATMLTVSVINYLTVRG
mgnify:CR=1 FL=1